MLLLRRTIAALRSGGAEVTLLAPSAAGAVLLGPGRAEVQRLVGWERADVAALFGEASALPETLRRDLDGHAAAVAFTRSDGVLRRLRSLVPRVAGRDPQPPPGQPATRWLAGSAEALGFAAADEPDDGTVSSEEAARAAPWRERLPRGFLALHPGSGSPAKNWPLERYLELASLLGAPQPWLLVSGPAEAAAREAVRGRTDCLIAEGLPLRVLGALLGAAGAFVGNDSGVSHLAAAWGAPTVALFGPTDARVWAPEGRRLRTVQSPTGEMAGISTGAVAEAVRGLGLR